MQIMSNNGRFGVANPLRANPQGMRGLGSFLPVSWGDTTQTPGDTVAGSFTFDPATVTAINSELVFLTNWWRQVNGQQPLALAQSAPTVNVGLNQDTRNLLLLGAAGVLAVILLKPKRKARR